MKITGLTVQVAEYKNYKPVPVPVRDIRAVAAFLGALADAPEALSIRIGTLSVTLNVEQEPVEEPLVTHAEWVVPPSTER